MFKRPSNDSSGKNNANANIDDISVPGFLKVGVKIEINFGANVSCEARVEGITKDGRLSVSIPERLDIGSGGQKVKVFYFPENERCHMDAEVESVVKRRAGQEVRIKFLSPPVVEPQRMYFRLNVDRVVDITRHKDIATLTVLGPEVTDVDKARIENVSETGALVYTSKSYEMGEKLFMRLRLMWPDPNAMPVNMLAEVTRIIHSEDGLDKIGVKFLSAMPHEKDTLLKFISAEQLKKGAKRDQNKG